jgi:predicted nuclease of predicted toxin-antitoxin system
VKLLIDENLSRKLVPRLSDLFPGSIHVTDVALAQSPDAESVLRREAIWIGQFESDSELGLLVIHKD